MTRNNYYSLFQNRLLFFDTEYHDKEESLESAQAKQKSGSLQNLLSSAGEQGVHPLIPVDLDDTRPDLAGEYTENASFCYREP